MRLKILFLTNRVPWPIRDGQARRTYHILRGLGEAHDVHLLSLYETPPEATSDTIEHLRGFCADVDLIRAPSKKPGFEMAVRLARSLFSPDPYTVWRHYSREYAQRVRQAIGSTAFDIVHCDILPMIYAVRNTDMPFCALTDHDVSYLKAERLAGQRRNIAAKLFIHYEAVKLKRLERRVFEHVDLVVAVSELDREILAHLTSTGRYAVVENGVDTEAFTPDPSVVDPNHLVWVGGFHHQSNYEAVRYFLDEIYPAVKSAHSGVTLALVGGDVPERLRSRVAHDSSVCLTGYVSDPLPYVQRAAIFVAPILSGSGTKLKVLEAMAAGKAIVSTAVGVEGIEGRDGEHFLIANEPSAFSKRIGQLLGDANLRKRLGTNARDLSRQKYDWTAICEKMANVYLAASGNAAGAPSFH
jgi:glycosyltransferase involved in cell wall biosynthesis